MTVTIYTSGPSCMACKQTKRHLDRRGITYTEVAIDSDPGILEAIKGLGLTSAPVVVVATDDGGERSWDGYRPDRIDRLAQLITAASN